MAPRIHERTRDRVSAVQVLYTSELTGKSPSELLDCGLCLVAREAPADEAEAAEAGFVNLKGHRLVGGMRASIYNAMPAEGVDKLVDFMEKFRKENA